MRKNWILRLALTGLLAFASAALASQPSAEAPELAPTQVYTDIAQAGSRFIAVGERGAIRVSDDNGESWKVVDSAVDVMLTAVVFASEREAWAVGHGAVLLHSDDAGSSWQKVSLDGVVEPDQVFIDIAFGKEGEGYVIGPDEWVLATQDGGKTWAREMFGASPYYPDMSSVAVLDSGHVLITYGGLEILRKAPGDTTWQTQEVRGGSIFGVMGLGGRQAMVFGEYGVVLESSDAGETWVEVKSASRGAYFAGLKLADGEVVLVGAEGIIARRAVGADVFLPEVPIPVAALTSVAEGEGGRLVLTGAQGVGYQQDGAFYFDGVGPDGYSGQLVARSLLYRTELPKVLQLVAKRSSRYSPAGDDWAVEWVEVALRAGSSDADVLTPEVFNDLGKFYGRVAASPELERSNVRSLWDPETYSYLMLHGPYGDLTSVPVVHEKPVYDDSERPYLEQRIARAGLLGNVISSDFETVNAFVDIPGYATAEGDNTRRATVLSALKSLGVEAGRNEHSYKVAAVELARLESADLAQSNDETATPNVEYVYVISTASSDSSSCGRTEDALVLADELAGYLATRKIPGPALAVSDLAKLNRIVRHRGNWKWYSTDDFDDYGGSVYGYWEVDYCVNPLVVVFGKHGAGDQQDHLKEMLEQFGKADELELSTFRVTRTAL